MAAVIGAAGVWCAAPLVTAAAGVMAMVLVARAARLLPPGLTLQPQGAAERLAVLDPALVADLARTRRALTRPELIAHLRRVVTRLVEVLALLRADGRHLSHRELRLVDERLHQLARHAFRLATSVDRLARLGGDEDAAGARIASTTEQSAGYLDALAQRLAELKGHILDLHRAEARRELLAGPLRALWEHEGQLESAAVLAEA
ncbi:MAG TPA: hypothetical protein VGQ83_21785 [Polyangia bacterium]